MVTGRRMTFDIRRATLNRRNEFRAVSRLRRGYSCSANRRNVQLTNPNHASTRHKAWHIAAAR
jgi:hypothetical protein